MNYGPYRVFRCTFRSWWRFQPILPALVMILLGCGPQLDDIDWVTSDSRTLSDMPGYEKIELRMDMIHASDWHHNHPPWAMVDHRFDSFWHVDSEGYRPKVDERWPPPSFTIDLDKRRVVCGIRVKPRSDRPDQIWWGRSAVLLGSNDNRFWHSIVGLENTISGKSPALWRSFNFPNQRAYRYYKVVFHDPFFMSLTEVELYTSSVSAGP